MTTNDDPASGKNESAITDERNVVWLYPIEDVDYVRSSTVNVTARRGELHYRKGSGYFTTVGYTELAFDALPVMSNRNGPKYRRRVFWLKDPDRPLNGDPTWDVKAPAGAVDPRTVAPGVAGELTDRACGRRT